MSWTWHYDNHPVEILKVMIYLTDDALGIKRSFEYLRSSRTREGTMSDSGSAGGAGRVSTEKAVLSCGRCRISKSNWPKRNPPVFR